MQAIFVRMDKIGDLILNLAVDQSPAVAGMKIKWWITAGLEFVSENSLPRRDVFSVSKKFGIRRFFATVREIRRIRPDVAVLFYAPGWVSWAFWLARVPIRIGRQSRWHSFFTFSHGVRQSRSKSEKHESQYNWELLHDGLKRAGLISQAFTPPSGLPPVLQLTAPAMDVAEFDLKSSDYFVVHPGMAGSALNWPSTRYIELIKRLTGTGRQVAITGTAADTKYIEPLRRELEGNPHVVWLDGRLKPNALLSVLKSSLAVIGPSTGVIHLAAALGIPTLGIYSPIRSHSKNRWGPRGERVSVLSPTGEFKDETLARKAMEAITVNDAVQNLEQLLGMKL